MDNRAVLGFCVTHRMPQHFCVGTNEEVLVWLGEGEVPEEWKDRVIIVNDVFHDLSFYRPMLMGGAGSFAIVRVLKRMALDNSDILIRITNHRKFVTNREVGVRSMINPGIRLVSEGYRYDRQLGMPRGSDFLLPAPIYIPGYLAQYSAVHKVEDLLRFCAIAIEFGVIDRHGELNDFLFGQRKFIIGGGELGVIPAKIFVKIYEQLEKVALAFCSSTRPVDLSTAQRRAVSFCCERFGSYLLLKEINNIYAGAVPENVWGFLNHATNDREYFPAE